MPMGSITVSEAGQRERAPRRRSVRWAGHGGVAARCSGRSDRCQAADARSWL